MLPTNDEGAPYGSPEAYREFIAENLQMIQIHAELGVLHASVGDDTGLTYAVRRIMAYYKAVFETLTDLKAHKQREHQS